ncbi:MAG: TlpA disulfide reductase family protein [Bacteroidota bacterium]
MKNILLAICLLAGVTTLKAQPAKLLIDQPAPAIVFQYSLDKPVKPDFYKGKILVIDFWATWCAPCIANFPHFNQLAKTYQSKDVVFAIMTDEPLATAQKFFARTQKHVTGLSLVDTSKKTMNDYDVRFIPYSVVIDKDNVVRWTGVGSDLTAAILTSIIKNEKPAAVKPAETAVPVVTTAPAKPVRPASPLFSFNITPAKGGSPGGSASGFKGDAISLRKTNSQLGDILADITGYGRTSRLITNDTARLSQLLDLDFSSKFDTTLFNKYSNTVIAGYPRKNMIIGLMGDGLKFNAKVIKQTKKHYELVVTDSAKLHTFKSLQTRHSSFSDDNLPHFEIVGYTLKNISTNLEGSAKIIITTNIADAARYDLSLDVGNIKTLQQSLNFHGLALKEVDGDVEFLNISFY